MARIFKQRYTKTTPDGGKVTLFTRNWYIEYRDADGVRRRVPGYRDRKATDQLAAQLEREAERRNVGLIDHRIDHVRKPLTEHVGDYETYLIAKQTSQSHRQQTLRRLGQCLTACSFSFLPDIVPTPVERYLTLLIERGCGLRTRNSHFSSICAFTHWCVKTGRLADDPLAIIGRANEAEDVRRKRRAATEVELGNLLFVAELRPLAERGRNTRRREQLTLDTIQAAASKARDRLRLKPAEITKLERLGHERRLIYMTLVLTGLRRGELEGLTWRSLDLDRAAPTLTVEAKTAKGGKTDVLPVKANLAKELRAWRETCGTPNPMSRVFRVPKALIHIFKRDLRAADIPFMDDSGRQLDVHALRHTTGTYLAKAGIAPRTAQALMRHSKIDLTMQTYTDPRLLDLSAAVNALPDLGADRAERTQQRATGTAGAASLKRTGTGAKSLPPGLPLCLPTLGASKASPAASHCTETVNDSHVSHQDDSVKQGVFCTSTHRVAPDCSDKLNSGRTDSNRQHSAWKADALPIELRPQTPKSQ